MKKLIKNTFYASTGVALLGLNKLASAWTADWDLWTGKVNPIWEQGELDQAVQRYITNFMVFLSLIAVIYALWGWFNILTAGWDEEKVKKWKTVIIQAAAWLLVIWIARSIIIWVISLFT